MAVVQWTLHSILYPPWTIVRGPCAHPMHGGTDWYLYKRDPWKKVREKTWALVRRHERRRKLRLQAYRARTGTAEAV